MNKKKGIKESIPALLWLSVLCIYWTGIIRINFSQNPLLYCADMYSDLMYAAAAWQSGSIFPEGWVFGNQYYAVATPVLAALMFLFTDDPCIAMGTAATCMGLGVLLSFNWMLRPVFPQLHQRLAAAVLFMTAVLWCGDAALAVNGWQLFFTMCAYYSCYAITAFLAFGCYLRRHRKWSPGFCIMLLLTCGFSFGTGLQSLRQTVITVIPIATAAGWETADLLRRGKPVSLRSLLLTGALTLSNLSGVAFASRASVPKHEIFGSLSVSPVPDPVSAAGNALGLFGNGWILGLAAILATCVCLWKRRGNSVWTCLFLCLSSTAAVFAIDTFTAIQIRSIYYFLLFPMAATVFVYWCPPGRTVHSILAMGFLLLALASGRHNLESFPSWQDDHPIQSVSDCLEENDISVVFTQWNLGEKIAIASDFRIQAGFWDAAGDVFEPVEYLCDPAVFDTESSNCAYLVCGTQNLALTRDRAEAKGADICILNYIQELDLYIFTSDQRLMEP